MPAQNPGEFSPFKALENQMRHAATNAVMPRKKLANNTYLHRTDDGAGAIAIRLHATDVATITPENHVTLESGGWRTLTTKDRMGYVEGLTVWQDGGYWTVSIRRPGADPVTFDYFDGMTIDLIEGHLVNPEEMPDIDATREENQAIKARIKIYLDGFTPEIAQQLIDGIETGQWRGDCLFCQFGDQVSSSDHLESHLEESYYMVSLVHNAARAAGYVDPGLILHMALRDAARGNGRMVRKVVGKYLRKALLRDVAATR